jgi:hypothetical protein
LKPEYINKVVRDPKSTLCSGVYIKGEIEGVPILFTADTGASKSVISTRVFDRIGRNRNELRQ